MISVGRRNSLGTTSAFGTKRTNYACFVTSATDPADRGSIAAHAAPLPAAKMITAGSPDLQRTPIRFYIMLKADPGNYELVRRVLGHRSITTARNFYIGLETLEATRLFGEMVTGLERGEVANQTIQEKEPCLRK
jgi:hypothetical protein